MSCIYKINVDKRKARKWGGATRVVKASLVFLCDYVTSCLIYPSKATIHVPPSTYFLKI